MSKKWLTLFYPVTTITMTTLTKTMWSLRWPPIYVCYNGSIFLKAEPLSTSVSLPVCLSQINWTTSRDTNCKKPSKSKTVCPIVVGILRPKNIELILGLLAQFQHHPCTHAPLTARNVFVVIVSWSQQRFIFHTLSLFCTHSCTICCWKRITRWRSEYFKNQLLPYLAAVDRSVWDCYTC